MHDSWVISVTRSDDHIRIELDSIEGSVFCAELGLWLDVDLPLQLMPVELHCHGVCYARWARHTTQSGWLKHSPPRFRPLDPTRTISDAFVYDFFHAQEGRIQWIAMFRAWSNPSDFRKSDLYLMADCTGVSAVDRRAEAVRDAFGARFESLWHEFFIQTEFDVWDQPQLFALFESVSKREGWTKTDLRQELLQVPGAKTLN